MAEEAAPSVTTEGTRYTYSASIFAHAPAATPTDFWTLLAPNVAGKTARLHRLWITGRATAATWYRIRLLKYSVIYTGGTPAAVTMVPNDSADPAAASLIQTWNGGLPTPGTLVGAICDDMLPLQAATMTATQPFTGPPGILWDFGVRNGRSAVLRGALAPQQYLALNAAAVALPAGTVLDIKAEFTEDNS